MALVQPVHKALHPGVHNRLGLGLGHGRLAAGLAGLHHACQVVHRIEVHIAQFLYFRLDVAWHCQVDHKHGAALVFFQGSMPFSV